MADDPVFTFAPTDGAWQPKRDGDAEEEPGVVWVIERLVSGENAYYCKDLGTFVQRIGQASRFPDHDTAAEVLASTMSGNGKVTRHLSSTITVEG